MSKKKLSSVLVCILVSLNLCFIATNASYAAQCSKKDSATWWDQTGENEDFNGVYFAASLDGSDETIATVFEFVESWKKATKSKKLKTALTKFLDAFDQYADSGKMYSTIPELSKAFSNINTIVKFNRC